MSKVLIEVLVIILIAGSYLILYSAVRVSAIADQRIAEIQRRETFDKEKQLNEKGFSARNLWNMKKWYLFYSSSDIFSEMAHTIEDSIDLNSLKLQQVGAEISENQKLHQAGAEIEFPAIFGFVPWRHHVEIVTKCKTIEEALFYVRKTIEESWSRSTLVDCIKANLYQSSGNALTNFAEKLPAIQGKLAQEIVKDTYDFGFVSLPVGYDEEELEDALEQNITRFLLELGSGFAFIGRQKEIIVAGKTRKIDMLFYHIKGMFRQYRAALKESKQSIKTKNSSIKVAGAAGAQTALSQMEGGEEVKDAANIAYVATRPVTGTASKGAELFRRKALAEKRKRIKKVEAGKKLAKKTAKETAKTAAKEASKETAKAAAKEGAKVAAKVGTTVAGTAAGAETGPYAPLIGIAVGKAVGDKLDKMDAKRNSRNRKIKFFLDKMKADCVCGF